MTKGYALYREEFLKGANGLVAKYSYPNFDETEPMLSLEEFEADMEMAKFFENMN